MKNTELVKLKTLMQKNHETAIAAIDQLIAHWTELRPSTGTALTPVLVVNRPRKSTYEIAEDLIKDSTQDFGVDDILLKLKAAGKTPNSDHARTISQVINKLRQRNPSEIEVVEKGRGRRSGVYRYRNPRL